MEKTVRGSQKVGIELDWATFGVPPVFPLSVEIQSQHPVGVLQPLLVEQHPWPSGTGCGSRLHVKADASCLAVNLGTLSPSSATGEKVGLGLFHLSQLFRYSKIVFMFSHHFSLVWV